MKFKELKNDDEKVELFGKIYKDKSLSWDDRMRALMELTNKSERTVRKWANKLDLKERVEIESKEFKIAKAKTIDETKKRFIITWAQNNTPVQEKFIRNVESYARHIDAAIHVIAGRYKNPTSIFTDKKHDHWDRRIKKYLDAGRHDVHKYLSIMSDVKIQPTAVNPMTGLEGMSGINSCVFGSPKIQLETIPVLEGNKPKMMLTTGACTINNYTDSKAGKKGEFHHNLGFIIVEIKDEETFYIRQVTATDDGDFSDLCYDVKFEGEEEEIVFDTLIEEIEWKKKNFGADAVKLKGRTKITKKGTIEAIVLGDLHFGHHDEGVLDSTLALMNKIRPDHVLLHDVFDGTSINHHEMKDPFIQYAKDLTNENNLEVEINQMLEGLRLFEDFKNVVIVRSNHDDFLDRWLKNEDWKKQPTPKNSLLYMEYSAMLLRQHAKDNVRGVIPEVINQKFPQYITLGRGDSYRVKGFELGQHGDIGSNGSRGSVNQFRKLNTKIVVGHYHSPGRKDNVLSVGTSTKLRLRYNSGPSSWAQAHVIIHENGKPQHILFNSDKEGEIGFTTLF